jgi:hypothetical protein
MSYNPQIKGVGETRWSGNGLYFATEAEALAYAADLQGRWMGCQGGAENRRAEPSDITVNVRWENGQTHRIIARLGPGEII